MNATALQDLVKSQLNQHEGQRDLVEDSVNDETLRKMLKNKNFIRFYEKYRENLDKSMTVMDYEANKKADGTSPPPNKKTNFDKLLKQFIEENSFFRKH